MFTPAPRVQVPSAAASGEVFPVKTLISHLMETGLRRDNQGNAIPRKIVNKFICRHNGVTLEVAMAAEEPASGLSAA